MSQLVLISYKYKVYINKLFLLSYVSISSYLSTEFNRKITMKLNSEFEMWSFLDVSSQTTDGGEGKNKDMEMSTTTSQ